MQTSVFTTRIDTSVLDIIKQFADNTQTTQRQIIEEAIHLFAIQKKKNAIKRSFSHIWKDEDMITFAETDMSDFLDSYNS